ncbi:MAG: MgtC/SapB family protein [Proteobacteria bacterium]|nr:MgtC/SapB family protein [Pseudomonadota bacterium]
MQQVTLGIGDIALRLGLALACGGLIGLNRDLHHKGAGLRTFGLVALATAGVTVGTLTLAGSQPDNIGRVAQGLLAGIGFLGAGVIMRRPDKVRVTGLTTAAAIWFVAGLSMLCGLGDFALVGILIALAVALLVGGRALERVVERVFGRASDEDDGPLPPADD